jgi:hypothetical protein
VWRARGLRGPGKEAWFLPLRRGLVSAAAPWCRIFPTAFWAVRLHAGDGCRWRFAHAHATLLRMTMKDFMSLVAVVVGMLLVLVTA